MKTYEIREKYLSFFQDKGCKRMASSSLIPDDPSLLLTSAGMVQFKQYFLGKKKLDAIGATTCQKCVRTTDIDDIGKDGRHLSFFEMLGNFSFGGYDKAQAIRWAYEFITEHLKLPLDRLYFSVYLDDDEAFDLWRQLGVPEDHIVRLGDDDNFWAAGPTGPCGPCSEIYYDQGPEAVSCDNPDCAPGCDCDRFLEFWNLVFTQYDRQEDGTLVPLPCGNIDTGMGLERMAAIMQGVTANYDTDILRGLIELGEKLSNTPYGKDAKSDMSLRIMADHSRAVSFMIADGILPSNEGRGYVLRRLLRRAVRHARLLGIEGPFLSQFVDAIAREMGGVYGELNENLQLVHSIIQAEEERFSATLKTGLSYLEEALAELSPGEKLSGHTAFTLHDTFGFPIDLTVEMAQEAGVELDLAGFEAEMQQQKERARSQLKDVAWTNFNNVWTELSGRYKETEFVGYEKDEDEALILALVQDGKLIQELNQAGDQPQLVELVLDKTPCYAERGGQVGDQGSIVALDGSFELKVLDTQLKEKTLVSHICELSAGKLQTQARVRVKIDRLRREKIRRNHTATHILHWALREVLGDHVTQAGSYTADDRLRFDITHFEAITPEQLEEIEQLCNQKIMEDFPVLNYETSLQTARDNGVIALFGEKYGEQVRVIEVGGFSKELCGGTHVGRSSEIGLLKIVSESSVGANQRRIECLTSFAALAYLKEKEALLEQCASLIKAPLKDLPVKIESLQKRVKELEKENKKLKSGGQTQDFDALLSQVVQLPAYDYLVAELEGHDASSLRELWDRLQQKNPRLAVFLTSVNESGAPLLMAAASQTAVDAGFHAGSLIKQAAPLVKGGGGGKPQMAQAGGRDATGIPAALKLAREYFETL